MNCATCKHWHNPWRDGPTPSDDEARGDGDYRIEPGYWLRQEIWDLSYVASDGNPTWGTCTLIDMAAHEAPSVPAFVIDGSDYKAVLYTGETFGCVLHEARADEDPSSRIPRMAGARRVPAEPGVDTSRPDDHGLLP